MLSPFSSPFSGNMSPFSQPEIFETVRKKNQLRVLLALYLLRSGCI